MEDSKKIAEASVLGILSFSLAIGFTTCYEKDILSLDIPAPLPIACLVGQAFIIFHMSFFILKKIVDGLLEDDVSTPVNLTPISIPPNRTFFRRTFEREDTPRHREYSSQPGLAVENEGEDSGDREVNDVYQASWEK